MKLNATLNRLAIVLLLVSPPILAQHQQAFPEIQQISTSLGRVEQWRWSSSYAYASGENGWCASTTGKCSR